jgi:translin
MDVVFVSLKSLLGKIQAELKERDVIKEEVYRDMRRATRLSKQSTLLVHQGRVKDAETPLKEAKRLLGKLRRKSKGHPDLAYSGIVDAAYEEYSEANVLLMLIKGEGFPSPKKLGVPSLSYVLGLGDVIGELRRRTLDALKKGDVELAKDTLLLMEEIYVELLSMDEAFLIVPGLRRKCDIGRRIIETTRGDVTIETRRSSLEQSIKELKDAVQRKRKARKRRVS